MRMQAVKKEERQKREKELAETRQELRRYFGFGVHKAKEIKVCKCCGAICEAKDAWCINCGEHLSKKNLYEESVEEAEKCRSCKAILNGAEKYCPVCGNEILKD